MCFLPKPIDRLFRRAHHTYADLALSADEIERAEYKGVIGGEAGFWDSRGRFQLALMEACGMRAHSTLLDIGCGPLRGGVHFIRFLDRGNYWGIDYNPSFIAAAAHEVSLHGLAEKAPTIRLLSGFDFRSLGRRFDFAIAFSVLNHSSARERRAFLRNARDCLVPGGRLIVSHAGWMGPRDFKALGLRQTREFAAKDLDAPKYGWPAGTKRGLYPIYEFTAD